MTRSHLEAADRSAAFVTVARSSHGSPSAPRLWWIDTLGRQGTSVARTTLDGGLSSGGARGSFGTTTRNYGDVMVSAASHMSPAADPEKDSLTRQAPRLLSAGVSAFRTYRLSGIAQRAAYEIRLRSRLFGFQERRLLSMTRASSALELEPSDLSDLREWFQRPENLGAADRVIAATRSLQSGRYRALWRRRIRDWLASTMAQRSFDRTPVLRRRALVINGCRAP